MDFISNQAFDILAIVGAKTATMATATVGLTKTQIPLDADTTIEDLEAVEADYTGYARKAITWLAATVSDTGDVELVGTVPAFAPTDDDVPNTIYALFVYATLPAELLCLVAEFDNAPLPMIGPTSLLIVTLRFRADFGGIVAVVT